jgi:hypothetical protein
LHADVPKDDYKDDYAQQNRGLIDPAEVEIERDCVEIASAGGDRIKRRPRFRWIRRPPAAILSGQTRQVLIPLKQEPGWQRAGQIRSAPKIYVLDLFSSRVMFSP